MSSGSHTGSNPAGSRPDQARSQASKTSSTVLTLHHAAGSRRVLAHRDFRLLWLSQAGSVVADRLVIVALALYVNRIGTPTDVGIVLAAQTIPLVALLLFGGVWADRLPRHRVMVVTDISRGVLHAVL